MMNKNKKALGIMLGTLVFLLVLAVVLLSVIIISLAREDKPGITTPSRITQSQKPDNTGTPFPTGNWTSKKPPIQSSGPETSDQTDQSRPQTTAVQPQTGGTTGNTPKPPQPNVPVGEITTVENPDGSIVKKGAFRDDGPTGLHLVIEWEAKYASKNASTVNLTVQVYLQCYSIGVAARDIGSLMINGESSTFQTPSLFYSDNSQHYTLVTARSLTLTKASGTVPLEVDISAAWNYKGSYSGVEMEWLTVAGTIEV